MFKLALIQMLVQGGQKAANLERASRLVAQAAQAGAQLALLPEAVDLGWTHPSAQGEASPVPGGDTCETFRSLARQHRIYICSGVVERSGETPNKIYNAAILLSPEGELLLHHRKLNELEIGHSYYAQGDSLAVAQTPLGAIGLMICADAFARGQVITRALAMMGADIILSPSAWAVPANHDNLREPYGKLWIDNYSPVARDFRLWIAGCSNVGKLTDGPWKGRLCIGCSLVIGPDGQQVLIGPYGEQAESILYTTVDPPTRPARGDGWENLWSNR
jgi:predicted amidohydrolase